jgi:hypothetical protein
MARSKVTQVAIYDFDLLHDGQRCPSAKSQIVVQVVDDLDYEFLYVLAVQLDPVDLRGLPRIKADQTEWVLPIHLRGPPVHVWCNAICLH